MRAYIAVDDMMNSASVDLDVCMLKDQLGSKSVYGGDTIHVRQASVADAITLSHGNNTDHRGDATLTVYSLFAILQEAPAVFVTLAVRDENRENMCAYSLTRAITFNL